MYSFVGITLLLLSLLAGSVAIFIYAVPLYLRVLGVLGAVVMAVMLALYLAAVYDDLPKTQTAMWDINLGIPDTEVKFIKGEPGIAISPTIWRYSIDEVGVRSSEYVIGFKNGKVVHVDYFGDGTQAPYVPGLVIGDSQDAVTTRFGEPAKVLRSADSLGKLMVYPDLHLWVGLTRNRVTSMGIYTPGDWEPALPRL